MKTANAKASTRANLPAAVVEAVQQDAPTKAWARDITAAIKAAESDWGHLTKSEQKTATVSVWRVIQDNIQPDLVDSDRPWWEATADRQGLLIKFPEDQND